MRQYENTADLADAVASANLPSELVAEISSRDLRVDFRSRLAAEQSSHKSAMIRAMKTATNDSGVISLESLTKSLSSLNLDDTPPEHLIGQAELDGILLRSGSEEWTWL